MSKKDCRFISLLVFVLITSCVYRFTNQHVRIPDGGRTVAIAPIYNTSRIVLPHDLLWDALQKAFAGDGHLLLSSQKKADFYVQTHVHDARAFEFETDSSSAVQAPNFLDVGNPIAPKDYVNMHSAVLYSKREGLVFQVAIEIWDLRTKTLLLKKVYPLSAQFNMLAQQSTEESRYIRNEESFELLFVGQAKTLARQVVTDLFSLSYFDSDY